MAHPLLLKRAYDPAEAGDGFRVLVDRLWPRGISREALKLDLWAKELAPSNEVRKAFDHVPKRFEAFHSAYLAELAENPQAPDFVRQVAQALDQGAVTLVYAAKNEEFNQAVVLKDWLTHKLSSEKKG